MPMKSLCLFALAAVVLTGALESASAPESEITAITKRIEQRRPDLLKILTDKGGKAGEAHTGLLAIESSKTTAEERKILEQENEDRTKLLELLAQQTGIPAKVLGERRAARMIETLPAGARREVWNKDSNEWNWTSGAQPATPSSSPETNPHPNKKLPERVLTRGGVHAFDAPGGTQAPAEMPAFAAYRVKDEKLVEGRRWYQTDATPSAWLQEEDVMEWNQALVMRFTSMVGRDRMLFFKTREDVDRLVKMSPDDRSNKMGEIHRAIADRKPPEGFDVLAREPEMSRSTQKSPVVIPIVEHAPVVVDGFYSNYLKLAASVRSGDSSPGAPAASSPPPVPPQPSPVAKPNVDIVFCMDTTSSMGPYIAGTLKAVQEFTEGIAKKWSDRIRFGFVGYRDPQPEFAGKMGYGVNNFTPDLLPPAEFANLLATVKAVEHDPGDNIAEDVFTGMQTAIRSKWTEGSKSIKIIVLIGDACGNLPSFSSGNSSGQDADHIRLLADENEVNVCSIYIYDPRNDNDRETQEDRRHTREKAEEQFRAMSRNRDNSLQSVGEAAFYEVNYDKDGTAFASSVREPFERTAEFLSKLEGEQQPKPTEVPQTEEPKPAQAPKPSSLGTVFSHLLANAYVDWLPAQNSEPLPVDIKGWTLPIDFKIPANPRRTMDVRLLLTESQLKNLESRLSQILKAAQSTKDSNEDIFEALVRLSAWAIKDPSVMTLKGRFDELGFLDNLPYKSQILNLTAEGFKTVPLEERDAMLQSWEQMRQQYGRLLEDLQVAPKGPWQRLSPEGELVIELSLYGDLP